MSDKVFCEDCANYEKWGYFSCDFPNNKVDNWKARSEEYKESPMQKNASNDCKDYVRRRHIFGSLKDIWRCR